MNWTSVKERLPAPGLKVLVAVNHRSFDEPVFGYLRHRWYVQGTNSEFEVTHWCPLPELPKEE